MVAGLLSKLQHTHLMILNVRTAYGQIECDCKITTVVNNPSRSVIAKSKGVIAYRRGAKKCALNKQSLVLKQIESTTHRYKAWNLSFCSAVVGRGLRSRSVVWAGYLPQPRHKNHSQTNALAFAFGGATLPPSRLAAEYKPMHLKTKTMCRS